MSVRHKHTDSVFRTELSRQLSDRIGRNKDWSVPRAAKAVGVSTQAFYKYLDGTTTPKGEVMRKLVRLFPKMKFRVDEYDFGQDAWLPPSENSQSKPEQIVIPFGLPIPVTEKVIMIINKRDDDSVVVELQMKR